MPHTTSFIYPDIWQYRVEFYSDKYEAYKKRYPNRYPTQATVRQWATECNEAILTHNTTRLCSEMADEL